jgi:hypothetical protein
MRGEGVQSEEQLSDYTDKMRLHVMGKQLVRDVAKLTADKQATSTAREYAKITAVNGDGTLELDKGTENYPMPISNVRRTVGAEAKVGDVVVVETTQHVPLVTSIVSVDGDTDNRITGAIAEAQDAADSASTTATKATTTANAAKEAADKAATDIVTEYAASTSPTQEPTSGWSTTAPAYVEGQYIWMRHTVTYGSGKTETTDAVLLTGNQGETGPQGEKGDTGADGTDGASVTSVKLQYAICDSSTAAPTSSWQDSVPDWQTGKYIWQRSVTTIKSASGTATTQYSDAVLYGAFTSLAKSVDGNSSKITQTADALGVTFDSSGNATSTLIRETTDGIEVGKSADGSTYTGTHTLVGTDAFSIHDKKHEVLASFGATSASIGNGADLANLQVGKLLSIESCQSESYIITGSNGYSDLHIGAIASVDNFAGPQVALLKDANVVAAHADYYYFYGGTTSLYPATFTWAQFRKKLLTHTYVGSEVVTLTAADNTHSTCVLFTASAYKAITGVAFDTAKHNITCMNGDHDACAVIWSMTASYSEREGNIHLMCMTSQKVSGIIRVNYTITINAS